MYSDYFLPLVTELDVLISSFPHTKKDIGYGYRWTFPNGQWVDMIDYKKDGSTILRAGRGAWLVRQNPWLYGLFDEVLTVVAKLRVPSVATLHEKHIDVLLELLASIPKRVRANEWCVKEGRQSKEKNLS